MKIFFIYYHKTFDVQENCRLLVYIDYWYFLYKVMTAAPPSPRLCWRANFAPPTCLLSASPRSYEGNSAKRILFFTLDTMEPLYSNPLKWGHLCIQWNPFLPTPWNRTTLYTVEPPLFQPPKMRTPLYTVELLYSNDTPIILRIVG